MKRKPISVLHVIQWPVSGIVSLFKNIIPLMPEDEVESHIGFFYRDENTMMEFSRICASAHCLDLSKSYAKGIYGYHNLIKKISPDILHTHSFQPMVWGCLFNMGKARHVSTIHNDYPYFKEKNVKALFKRKAQMGLLKAFNIRVVAVSSNIYTALAGFGVPSRNLTLIENGIPLVGHNLEPGLLDSLKSEIGAGEKDIILATLGRLDIRQKGYDILLEAFREVCKKHKNTILMFIGDGSDKNKLMDMAETLGIASRVRFMGFKNKPEQYLSAADIYVCSSRHEGFSLAVIEAMFNQLPIVATRVGSNPEVIEDGVSGLLVESEDSKGIAVSLDELISNCHDRKLMGRVGKETIVQRYDVKKTADAYLCLYRTL